MENITRWAGRTAVLADNKLTITGTFDGLKSPATIAQVHKGPVTGVRGPVVFDLVATGTTSGTIKGTLTLTPVQFPVPDKRRLYIQIPTKKHPEVNSLRRSFVLKR